MIQPPLAATPKAPVTRVASWFYSDLGITVARSVASWRRPRCCQAALERSYLIHVSGSASHPPARFPLPSSAALLTRCRARAIHDPRGHKKRIPPPTDAFYLCVFRDRPRCGSPRRPSSASRELPSSPYGSWFPNLRFLRKKGSLDKGAHKLTYNITFSLFSKPRQSTGLE